MTVFSKKKPITALISQQHEVPFADFIPYACHYDPHTLLTKNGELVQVIKITGFSYETVGRVKVALREAVRRSVLDNIETNRIALWFHTIRKRTNLDPGGTYDNNFAAFLNYAWRTKHEWENKYVNTLYVSIIYDGQPVKVTSPVDFLRSLYPPLLQRSHEAHLEAAHEDLNRTVERMLVSLENFGAKRLGLYQESGITYSEPLQFLARIINLEEAPVKMPVSDISHYLPRSRIAFGNNAFEVIGDREKHFGAILTLKEYHELSTKILDALLQLPQRFIVTQSVDFVKRDEAVKDFKELSELLEVSGADDVAYQSGITEIMKNDTGSLVDFCQHQLTIMCVAGSLEQLQEDMRNAMYELGNMGVVAVREDLRMEQTYWSQLPANFRFLCRQNYIDTARIAGFASLHNFPAGKSSANHWGPAATIFHTEAGTPYFFNFHIGDNGHTLVVGPYGQGKTVLVNFLVSEARKFKNKLFYLDYSHASTVFVQALGGSYHSIEATQPGKAPSCALNPLGLSDTANNRRFLVKWLGYVLTAEGVLLEAADERLVDAVVNKLYTLMPEQRTLLNVAKMFQALGAVHMVQRLQPWFGSGSYAYLFDQRTDAFDVEDQKIYGFAMNAVVDEPKLLGPVLSYLFYRIETKLDGEPAIIVLDEAWKLVDNPLFAPDLEDWLERIKARNAMVIFATESMEDASHSQITRSIVEKTATQIYLPNPKATRVYEQVFGLSSEEYRLLTSMNKEKRHFLLKQGTDAIIARLDLSGMEELSILSGDEKKVELMEQAIRDAGANEPEAWVPVFYNLLYKEEVGG
ncbi:MAG: VirB4 family type secretion/conjugal transfer ATPase [Rickettsiales bacterium]|jgi:type IV secretion system protein VirB4|nr:VirB4 family type secretion/conjugal transfer ATPase [Rickettsiales bacterium]